MKKKYLFITLAVVIVAIAVAFVSCKKETGNTLAPKAANTQRTVDISKIEDMNVYLYDFRQKMTESKSGEAMNTEDAAWHLACLANYDFCRVNVEYNDFKFDTIEMQVNVTDGMVLMGDLNAAYEQMCAAIQQFKKGFCHYNENLYFINMFIDANGNAKITIKSTFTTTAKYLTNHQWYFGDELLAQIDCDTYFSSDSIYLWNGLAASELERILNIYEHHENNNPPGVICYAPTRSYTFQYPQWPDTYHSNFANDSRLYANLSYESSTPFVLSTDDMCYCLDSYLGLAYDYIIDNYYVNNEVPVNWDVSSIIYLFPKQKQYSYYHILQVDFGSLINVNPPTPDPD